jgi:hypothetical protein
MSNKILILCCSIILGGCASKPPATKIMENLNLATEISNLSQVLAIKPIKLTLNEKVSTSFEGKGKITNLIGAPSYYYVFEREYKSNSSGKFELNSYCSCWGFDKKVMVPKVLIFDSKGKSVEIKNLKHKTIGASGITPLHLLLAGDFHIDVAQSLKFGVLADNTSLDQVISNISIQNTYGRELMGLSVNSYPLGDFTFELGQL